VAGGFEDYALANQSTRTRLPVESFYVQAAYLLTGERVASRGMVKPLRPFDLRRGKLGPGAWEVAFRYNWLDLGNQVFTAGLADPNLWTNRLYTTDLGVSWYWNQYIRVLFDWQHAEFGSPVVYRPGALQKTSDLFLIRFQIWF
jgi:phosphate-selective porin OprO/OprP